MRRPINKIIIHCSDTPDYNKDGTERNHTVSDIDLWHKQKGWSEIGYHYVIDREGKVLKGRDIRKIGSHCYGHNDDSVGICLIGRSDFNDLQYAELGRFVNELCHKHDLDYYDVFGHRDFSNKDCPGFDVRDLFTVEI